MGRRVIAADSQILNTVMACGRKTNLEFKLNLRPHVKAEALEKGDLMHRMLHPYYYGRIKNPKPHHLTVRLEDGTGEAPHPYARFIGMDHKELVDTCTEIGRVASFDMDLEPEYRNECLKQFREYAFHFAGDGWFALEVEQSFTRTLYEDDDLRIDYEGIVDLVADGPMGVIAVDHKTASRREVPSDLSNQFMGYCWALDIPRLIINRIGFQKTLTPSERFQRIVLSYPQGRIDEWQYWATYWLKVYAFYLENDVWPPNFTSCDKYSGCIFQRICTRVPEAREFEMQTKFRVVEPWSPHTRDTSKLLG
jgi:hypothetical protein